MIAQPFKVQPLSSGQSNQTLRLISDSGDYVLKCWRNERLFAVDRRLEVAIQQHLAQDSLAPHLVDYHIEQGWLLQPYLQAPSLQQARLSALAKAGVLAETLAKIHSVRVDVPHWSMANRVEHYLQQLRLFNGSLAADMRRQLRPMKALLEDWLKNPVLCHNDLSMNHVLMADSIKVIDWEYAGIGHPLFDIASTIKINQLSHDMTARLISDYEKITRYQIDRQHLAQWCEFVDWLNEIWQHLLRQAS
ncbi:phosphotransferase [Idiomarina sp. HP20-50]|uniref:phosphotransferase n=1 Tax=Idiomarina sp. HP20-50 TaxID=3070813 RepID=UPI00294B4529|nr:phosphotransferase [Idiomarina sp. HP20-50]MDV6316756.1 phosphotransferase [Idiomarina sp. HP20-50]